MKVYLQIIIIIITWASFDLCHAVWVGLSAMPFWEEESLPMKVSVKDPWSVNKFGESTYIYKNRKIEKFVMSLVESLMCLLVWSPWRFSLNLNLTYLPHLTHGKGPGITWSWVVTVILSLDTWENSIQFIALVSGMLSSADYKPISRVFQPVQMRSRAWLDCND